MGWGAAVLAHLYRELGKASMKGKANCCAFLTLLQHIPDPVEAVERVTMQGKTDEDWSTYHEKYIKQWDNRLLTVADQQNTVNSDPTHARNCYLEWYWRITRRWISTPVECPVISYQLSGHSEKALVDLITTVQVQIRTLLSGEMDGERVKESLGDIDMYITAEMKKVQFAVAPCTNEPTHLNYKHQHMVLSSGGLQVMQIVLPTEIGNESLKSATACSTFVDSVQANVGKVEQVTDGYMEGNTILQLDGMRGIQPGGGTLVRPPPRGDGTTNWTEDLHQQEDPIDVSMPEVNMQYIISTPVEDDVTEIINTSAENAMLEETSDAEMKNGEGPLRTSSPLSEIVEMQEAAKLMYNNKIHNKVNDESQEPADAPVINNSTVEETTRVLLKDNYMEATHIYPNNIAAEDILVMRTDNSIAEGAIGEALSATGPVETLSASLNKLSSMRGDAEPPSGSKQEEPQAAVPGSSELQDSVRKLPKDNAIQDRVHAVQNLMLQENVDDYIENGSLNPAVLQKLAVTPAHITIVGEKCIGPFTGEATDTSVEENSTGNGYPDQDEITKRRKVTVSSQENAEALPTTEVIKSEKQNGSGQLIAFTRRKRRKKLSSRLPES
ncbi:hypothetical protein ACQ4PT_049807 [Festuca glaucescens]